MSPHLKSLLSPLAQCLSLELNSFCRPDRQRQGPSWSLWQGTITRKQEGELEGEEALQHCEGNREKGGLVLGFLDIGWLIFLTLQMRTAEAWSRQGPTKTKCNVPGVLYQNLILGIGEGAQQPRAALSENPGLAFSTHTGKLTTAC